MLLQALVAACTFLASITFDRRPLTIQTFNLFAQQEPSRLSKASWIGDWIFRRARLSFIDAQLSRAKPDILALQDLVDRIGSPADSDRAILGAGALAEYDWYTAPFAVSETTQEEQSLGVTVGFPLRVDRARTGLLQSTYSDEDTQFALSVIEIEGQAILIANVNLSRDVNVLDILTERIRGAMTKLGLCSSRLVVAGKIPYSNQDLAFQAFLDRFALKDSAEGFCEIASNCFTASPLNNLYLAVRGDTEPAKLDSILVARESVVYSSKPTFTEAFEVTEYTKAFGLDSMYGAVRYGWSSQVKLPECPTTNF